MFNVKFLMSVLVAITIGLIGIQAEAQELDLQESDVSGTVVDAATGDALSGIEVKVEENGESAETNEEGEFSLDNLEPGTYTLVVEDEGYEEWSQTIEVTDQGTEVQISLQSSY